LQSTPTVAQIRMVPIVSRATLHVLARRPPSPDGTGLSSRPMNARSVYDELVDLFLVRPGVAVGRSLANETLTVGGKIFAFLKDESLVVKLPADVVAELVTSGEAVAFMAGGRTMREWAMLALPAQGGSERWRALMDQALSFVAQ
jgi:hypothetical protein